MPRIRESVVEDIGHLQDRLRAEDLLDLELTGETPEEALTHGFENSLSCKTLLVDGEPAAMFGIVPHGRSEITGIPWLLGSPEATKDPRWFARNSRRVFDELRKPFKWLFNSMHIENHVHREWVAWLGFKIIRVDGTSITFARFK